MKRFRDSAAFYHLPVIGLEDQYAVGYIDPPHSHPRAQLLYASSGMMSVTVEGANFAIPPQRALWIPSHVVHEVSCRGAVSLRTLYIDESVLGRVASDCRILEVSAFLRALILEMVRLETDYVVEGRAALIIELLLGELRAMPAAPYSVPMPTDSRLKRVCRSILDTPADKLTLQHLAEVAGMGRRTFCRLFKSETGMGVAAWRQQVRLMEALSMLSDGERVATVAYTVGYDSPSAFTAAFQKAFGRSPSTCRSTSKH